MPRTTEALVGGVCKVDKKIDLTPFIQAANGLVTDVCATYWGDDPDGRLVTIETWLAAHFYAIRDPRKTSYQVDVIRNDFETNRVDFDLRLTRYGQQALALDSSMLLAAYCNSLKDYKVAPPRAKLVTWLGTEDT